MTFQIAIAPVASRPAFAPIAAPRTRVRFLGRLLAGLAVAAAVLTMHGKPALAASAVPLGAASSFAVLGATPSVTNTGATIVTGDLGISPALAVTGFPPGTVIGTVYQGGAVAAAAQAANVTAYGQLAAQGCNVTFAAPTDMAGMTLTPGVYCFASSAANSGLLRLDAGGDTSAVWIFRTASTLTTGSGSSVVPIGGGQACNVFWQIGSSATLGTGTSMVGNILALASITLTTGTTLSGRALAQTGAVTLDTNSVAVCAAGPVINATNPTLAKAFNPTLITVGGVSILTVTLSNPNATIATLSASLVDTLPLGVLIAPSANGSTTCGGGTTVVASAGTDSLSLPSGRTIPANGTCTMTVSVTAPLVGSYVNLLPVSALQTSNGNNLAPAVATLTVSAQLPPGATPMTGAAVPTVSDWMLVLISTALTVLGFVMMRRRAKASDGNSG